MRQVQSAEVRRAGRADCEALAEVGLTPSSSMGIKEALVAKETFKRGHSGGSAGRVGVYFQPRRVESITEMDYWWLFSRVQFTGPVNGIRKTPFVPDVSLLCHKSWF